MGQGSGEGAPSGAIVLPMSEQRDFLPAQDCISEGPTASAPWPALAVVEGVAQAGGETLVAEVPVALVFNGVSHAVMLATPVGLEDFALGFALSEGIARSAADVRGVDVEGTPRGLVLQVELASGCFEALKARRRTLAGRTGCGLCGLDSLEAASPPVPPVGRTLRTEPDALARAARALADAQPLHRATGGCHAAAWALADGALLHVAEDVGRHNALDKLIGRRARALRADDPAWRAPGFVLMTSRASVELVHKCATAGIELLATVSAPTTLAARTAQAADITLVGWTRGARSVVYTHPERLGIAAG